MKHIFAFSHMQRKDLALGARFGLVLVAQVKGFGSRGVSIWTDFRDFLSFWAGLVIYSSYHVQQTTCLKSFHFLWTYPRKDSSAWTEVWTGTWPPTASIMAPGVGDLGKFDIPGGAGDINNSTSTLNYWYEPYIRLLPCAKKGFSAGGTVSPGTCRSRKRFWFPEGRDLDRFFEIFEILGGAGDINNSISMPIHYHTCLP